MLGENAIVGGGGLKHSRKIVGDREHVLLEATSFYFIGEPLLCNPFLPFVGFSSRQNARLSDYVQGLTKKNEVLLWLCQVTAALQLIVIIHNI